MCILCCVYLRYKSKQYLNRMGIDIGSWPNQSEAYRMCYLRGFDGSSWSWWLAIIWLVYKKFLDGGGKHFLQKEWRQGSSLGSLLWKFNLQMGQQSIKLWVLWAFSLSSWTGMLSASFSTIITISSGSTFSALSSMTDKITVSSDISGWCCCWNAKGEIRSDFV